MSGRITRMMRRTGINMLLARGRKPRILPMSREESRILAELNRRRALRLACRRGESTAEPKP
ncbi:hypothetical protein [Novosphingobium album (ex Liu et al. 2023)]|uniref:Transposase n=1 Tax=Novosphingobium album (ex Liu et al. 2023) TaxID=3031130 RepID=A0ABT5WY17_9SPHN|nr:hypothetical protein [Novosphingobium album (ex Liu et al. 2023)]MDE8654804.1 hypothetical protein [Novosphingobium album (ex Liu et al. 2023)]